MSKYSKRKEPFVNGIYKKIDREEHSGIKNRLIKKYGKDLSNKLKNVRLMDTLVDDDYMAIRRHIKMHIKGKLDRVIDIGCGNGIQSELFYKNYDYIGINENQSKDCCFNISEDNVSYIHGVYPQELDLQFKEGDVVILITGPETNMENEKDNNTLINHLREASILYIENNHPLFQVLKDYFKKSDWVNKTIRCLTR